MMLTDIHHHLIYGVDDGAQTFEQTRTMLYKAADEGISSILTTPHAAPGQIFFDLPLYLDHFQMAQAWCSENCIDMKLYPGAEIFYTESTLRMLDEQRIPTLNHTRYVLLEFPVNVAFNKLLSVAQQLTEADYLPVFAHVERYRCLSNTGHLRKLREKYGTLMQMNANTVLNAGGLWRQMWWKRILQMRLIDVVASDAHNTHSRSCRLGAAYEKLAEICGKDMAWKLCVENPLRIIAGE